MKIEIGLINHSENEGERVSLIWDSETLNIESGSGEKTELWALSYEAAQDKIKIAWGASAWALRLTPKPTKTVTMRHCDGSGQDPLVSRHRGWTDDELIAKAIKKHFGTSESPYWFRDEGLRASGNFGQVVSGGGKHRGSTLTYRMRIDIKE